MVAEAGLRIILIDHLSCCLDLSAFIVGVILFNILPDEDVSSIVVRDDGETPESSLEMGRVPGSEAMPYKGQTLDEENEDVKGSLGIHTKTRIEPAS